MPPHVAFNMVVFNMDYVLEAVLESIYPFASQIIITEGPVKHFVDLGFAASTDNTVEIIKSFPDPEKKISLTCGQWYLGKAEMINVHTPLMRPDIEFSWMVDGDEVYKPEDIQTVFDLLVALADASESQILGLGKPRLGLRQAS